MSERVKVTRIMDVLSAADTGKLVFNDENAVMAVSACGNSDNRDALLALADDIDKQTDGSMFDAWLEDGHYIARRIREACGEEVRNG